MISGACTNNGSKIKLSTNRGHITFPWIWGLTGITFARRKSIAIARKIYLRLFFTFERITCYLEYIWFTHNIFCILQHDWRCNMQGRIQDFKLGGGGGRFKKLRRAEGGAKFVGYFVWRITILCQKIIFFPILRGRAPSARPPPPPPPHLDPPLIWIIRLFCQPLKWKQKI